MTVLAVPTRSTFPRLTSCNGLLNWNTANFTLDDVIEAWPEVLGVLKAPVRAAVQDAQPIALDDGVIVFGVPSRRKDAGRSPGPARPSRNGRRRRRDRAR